MIMIEPSGALLGKGKIRLEKYKITVSASEGMLGKKTESKKGRFLVFKKYTTKVTTCEGNKT